jgi:hypothetical protein
MCVTSSAFEKSLITNAAVGSVTLSKKPGRTDGVLILSYSPSEKYPMRVDIQNIFAPAKKEVSH